MKDELRIPAENLPTSVGMYRYNDHQRNGRGQSPHKRGDVPNRYTNETGRVRISPQAWGCTGRALLGILYSGNLPTSVGMYRDWMARGTVRVQSPHKRGDVPSLMNTVGTKLSISPQAWGCTVTREKAMAKMVNLPTSVGMYRPYGRG